MTLLTLLAPHEIPEPAPADPPTPPTPPDPGEPVTFELAKPELIGYAAERDGTVLGELVGGRLVEGEYVLSGPGAARARILAGASGLTHLKRDDGLPAVGNPEIHWYLDDRCIYQMWPQVWTFDPVSRWIDFEGWDPLGHLPLIVFGDAERTNYLTDGTMEAASTAAWQALDGVTLTKVLSPTARGSRSLKVECGVDANAASQVVTIPASNRRTVWYAVGHVLVPEGTQPPAGLRVTRYYDGGGPGNTVSFWSSEISPADFPRDEWVRLEVGPMGADPFRAAQFAVQPWGTADAIVYWDEVRLVRNDNTGVTYGADLARLVSETVRYASMKAGLKLRRKVTEAAITLDAGYRYEHTDHAATIRGIDDHRGFIDVRFSHQTRTVHIGPDLGTVRDVDLIPEKVTVSGTQMRTSAISIGARGGVAGDEAGNVLVGAPVLWETVERAPADLTLKDLDRRPAGIVNELGVPAQMVTARLPVPEDWRVPADWLMLGLAPGDTVNVPVGMDPFDLATLHRIAKLTLRPDDGFALVPELVAVT